MREIKFRAWDKEEKKMVMFCEISNGVLYLTTKTTLNKELNKHIPMQFTGLKDKNGVEIYEGDIVHFKDSMKRGEVGFMGYDEVYYNKYAACWGTVAWNRSFTPFNTHCVHGSTDGGGVVCGKMLKTEEELEVIGNIYENPELLKEN